MQVGDLMMLGEGATLYSPLDHTMCEVQVQSDIPGDIVTLVRLSDQHTIVRVLHPTLGLRDVFAHQLHPMTGGSNEAR